MGLQGRPPIVPYCKGVLEHRFLYRISPMAACISVGIPAGAPSASNSVKNGVYTAAFSHRSVASPVSKRNVAKFSVKWKLMCHNGLTQENSTVVENSSRTEIIQLPKSAADIVKEFYSGVNRHDLDSIRGLIAEDCVYEDLVFPQAFVGNKAILDFLKKFIDAVSTDLQFVIDDITGEDSSAVGVTWHLEWRGKPFPFSKGCSFYRSEILNGKRQIIYGRDSVEPPTKPGDMALVAIKALSSLLARFPQLADRF